MANANRQVAGGGSKAVEPGSGVKLADNRFVRLYGEVSFKAEAKKDPYLFPKGAARETQTAQTGLAEVVFVNFGNVPGARYTACRIVHRIDPTGKQTFHFTMPSTRIGPTNHPVLNVKGCDEAIRKEFEEFQHGIVDQWKAWRTKEVAAGFKDVRQASLSGVVIPVNNDDMAALGYNFGGEEDAPKVEAAK